MPDLLLTESRQAARRSLLAAEPVLGRPLPPRHLLETLSTLCPATSSVWASATVTGDAWRSSSSLRDRAVAAESSQVPGGADSDLDEDDGPPLTGWLHWSRNPRIAEECGDWFGMDDLTLGFLNGVDHVVQIMFVRESTMFSDKELALARMLFPVLERLVRERPTPYLPASLTVSERRVLAAGRHTGRSNREIAAVLWVAESTVCKHLENAYRKLGVSNRIGAVARMNSDRGTAGVKANLATFEGTRMGLEDSSF